MREVIQKNKTKSPARIHRRRKSLSDYLQSVVNRGPVRVIMKDGKKVNE